MAHQQYTDGYSWLNVAGYANLYHLKMHRKYVTSADFDTWNIGDDIDFLINSSSGSSTKLWRQASTHGVIFTGDNQWWQDFWLRRYLMDHIADNYGEKGSDNMRVAGPQEVYEYLATKQGTNVSSTISGNQLIITLDIANAPNDQRRSSLSLVTTGGDAHITNIQYQSGAFTYHSENKVNWLINLEMGEYFPNDKKPNAFQLNQLTWVQLNQVYTSNVVTITGMSSGLDNIIYLSGDTSASLYKNGVNIWTSGTWANGDQFAITMTGSNTYTTTKTSQLLIGPESSTFSLLTQDDGDPDQFTFTALTWATLNQLYTSNTITLSWMTNGLNNTISISWRGTLYKNGVNIGTSGTWANGDQFYIAINASSGYYTTRIGTITIWAISSSRYVSTLTNLNPDTFSFSAVNGATRNQLYTSNIITLAGITSGFSNTISLAWSGTLYKNGINIWTSGTWTNGDQFSISLTSSPNYYETYTSTVTIGTTSGSRAVTTLTNLNPNQFSFSSTLDTQINQVYTSNIITLTGITNGFNNTVILSGWGTLYKNGINIGTSGTWASGDQFAIAMNASTNYYTTRIGTLTIGTTSWSWSVTTVQNGLTTSTRNNDNYINNSFWSTNPSTGQIINALFGDGNGTWYGWSDKSAYTQLWTWSCNVRQMNVKDIQNYDISGINVLPSTLIANTIYVLEPWRHVMSSQLSAGGDCIAIIGKGIVNMYTTGASSVNAMFAATNHKNFIVDNVNIDGLSNWSEQLRGTMSSANGYGVELYNVTNASLHKLNVYNNKNDIEVDLSTNVVTSDSAIYNSSIGGYATYGGSIGQKTYITNVQIFNNASTAVSVQNAYNVIFNNIQVYNNGFIGINFNSWWNNIIANSQIYNNLWYGLRLQTSSQNNILYNSRFYNNSTQWIYVSSSGGNATFYGALKMFNNSNTASANNIVTWIVAGNINDPIISWMNWSTGILDTGGLISSVYTTNPVFKNSTYLITWTNRTGVNRGNITSTSWFINYLYGMGIFHQTGNVTYNTNGTTIIPLTTLSYDSTKYIAQLTLNTEPDGFSFSPVTGATLNQLYTSNTITINGMETGFSTAYTFNGRGTLYKNNVPVWTSGTGINGDQFFITIPSSSNYFTLRYSTFQAGIISSTFSVTTQHDPSYNDTPSSFSFNDITWTIPNQLYTSNIITIADMSTGASNNIIINWAINSIYKNWINVWSSVTGWNGDQLYFDMNASNNYLTTISWSVSIGATSATRNVTTMIKPTTDPNSFTFTSVTWANINQLYTSNIITFSWMTNGIIANVVLNGSGLLYKNGNNIWTWGTWTNSDQFYIAITSSPSYLSSIFGTLVAGNTSAVFSITTKQDITPPLFTGATSGINSSGTVIITYRDDNFSWATLNGSPYASGTPITGEGNYSFMAYDTAGNSTGAIFSIIYPKTFIITFQNPISTGIITKAPLKYNKDVALSFSQDDGYGNAYNALYRYFNGGLVSWRNTNFIAPGLYSTDGAGNDIPFRGSLAWFSVSWIYQPPIQIHNSAWYWMSRDQLRETYINWRDIMNHGRQSAAYPTSWQQFIYPDNPPGTTGLDYTYELQKNIQAINNNIGLSWVIITQETNPSGDTGYVQPARNLWYRAIMGHPSGSTIRSYNVYNHLDPYQLLIPRQYYTDDNFPTTGSVVQDIDALMISWSSPTTKTRRSYFNHGEDFTGFDSSWHDNGGLKFSSFKYLADDMASYGKKGTDKIRVAGDQDVYEYIASKEQTNLSNSISWNQMVVTLDIANLYNDLRRKSLTLLVSGTNSPIQSIQYQSGAFTFHSENTGNGLINVERWEYVPGDRDPNAFNISPITWALRNQLYTSNIVTITGMSPGLDNIIYLSWDTSSLYKNWVNIGTQGTGANGDQFAIAMTGSNTYTTTKTSQLLIGPEYSTFTLLTQDDGDPDQFTFNVVTWASLNQLYTSNIITLTGMTNGISNIISISGRGTLYKNGVNIGTSWTWADGDQFYIAMNASSGYYTTRIGTITIGATSWSWSLTTLANLNPNVFSFTPINGATRNQLYTSNTISLAGITSGFSNTITLAWSGTLYKNWTNIGTSGTWANGDLFYISLTSSPNYYETYSDTVSVGTTSASRSLTTLANLNPNVFSFTPINGATRNQLYTSNTITLTWMTNGQSNVIAISWSGTLFKNWTNIGTSGTWANGDQFYISLTSSPNYYETYSDTVSVGTTSASWTLTTLANLNPSGFSFVWITWATRNQLYTSNTITLAGITNGFSNSISISWSGTLYKNGVNIGSSGTWANGDQFFISLTSSPNYYETYTGTLSIWTTSSSWAITTLSNLNPSQFSFTSITGATRNQLYTSNTITLAWMTNGFSNTISLAWSGILYKNGVNIGTSGTWTNGDLYYIAMNASSGYYTTNTGTVSIGTTSASWSVTTLANLNPSQFTFTAITGTTRNQLYTSNTITLAGMTNGQNNTISIVWSGILYKNGSNIGTSWTWTNGDQFSISLTSSPNYYETYTGTISIWTTSASRSITTLANVNPSPFSFLSITGATRNQLYTSNTITITGITNGFSNSISLAWSGTLSKNGVNIWTSWTGTNGDQFSISLTSNPNFIQTRTGTVTIGTTSASRTVTTTPDNIAPTGSFAINSGAQYTNTGIVWLTNITWSDDSYPLQVRFSNDKNNRSSRTGIGGNSNWTLSWNDWVQVAYAQFKDALGNATTGDILSTIILDTTAPTYTGVIDNQTYTTTVQVQFNDTNISWATLNGNAYISGTPITANNSYTLIISDLAGNTTTVHFQIINNNPSPFSFTAITWATRNQLYTSNTVTLTGMSAGSSNTAILLWGATLYKNGINIGTSGTWGNGDHFYITMTGSSGFLTSKTGTLSVGNQYADFVVTTQWDIFAPTGGSFVISNGATYTRNALVSIDNITGIDDTYPLQIRFSNDNTNRWSWMAMASTKSRTLSTSDGNKTVYMQIQDAIGNTTTWTISDSIILDTTAPSYSGVNNLWIYSGNVSVQYSDVNISGATLNGNTYTSGTPITQEGSYTLMISDLAGNSTTITFSIDKTVHGILSYSPVWPQWTSGNVTMSITGIGEGIYVTNNWGSTNYTFTNDGNFTYIFRDSVGNTNSLSGSVNWIDKQGPSSPTLVFPVDANHYGATSITLQRNATADSTGGIGTIGGYFYNIKRNGVLYGTWSTMGTSQEIANFPDGNYTWQVVAYDGLGNQWARSDEHSFMIDTQLPSATIVYQPWSGQWTSGNVVANITGFNKAMSYINTGSYTFNDNGSFTFTFQDEAGNTWVTLANVRWIDRVPPSAPSITNLVAGQKINPSLTVLQIQAGAYTGAPIVNYEYEVSTTSNMDNIVDRWNSAINTFSLQENNDGNYYIKTRVEDAAGNYSSRSNAISFAIDTTKPTVSITYSPDTWPTTGNVFASIGDTSEVITGLNQTGYTFIQNGSFTFTFQDEAGNTWEALASVDWIQTDRVILIQTGNAVDMFIKNGYNENTGTGSSLFSQEEIQTGTTVIGSLPIVFDQYTTIPTQVILQSVVDSWSTWDQTNQIAEIKIPENTIITGWWVSCNQTLFAPTFAGKDVAQANLSSENIYSSIKAGMSCLNSSVLFKKGDNTNQNITIKIKDDSIPNGTVKVWYSSNANDWTYLSTATASNGIVSFSTTHLTYFAVGSDKPAAPSSWWWGGWGWGWGGWGGGSVWWNTSTTTSPSSPSTWAQVTQSNTWGVECSISKSPYSFEINNAYLWSCGLGITTMPTIQSANIEGNLLRMHLAKMISTYIIQKKNISIDNDRVCNFVDMKHESQEMQYFANLACKLGIMGVQPDGKANQYFYPNATVTRAQFGTVLSRVLRGSTYTSPVNRPYYENHLLALKTFKIMNQISDPEHRIETRGNILLMLMRSNNILQ